jgi:5'-3' exonuclease
MGLEGVSEFIRRKYPDCIKEDHISVFAFKKICVDVSGFIYRFMSIYGKENYRWLQSFINLILLMKKNYINIIPVFDGKPPDEKKNELNNRKENKNSIKDKINTLENELIEYNKDEDKSNINIDTILKVLKQIKNTNKNEIKNKFLRNFLKLDDPSSSLENQVKEKNNILSETSENKSSLTNEDIELIYNYIEKQKSYLFNITVNDINILKELFSLFNISYIQSNSEAEQTCCSLVNEGLCDIVLSSDTDCIAHRVSIFIFQLDIQTGIIKYTTKKDLLESFEFDHDEQLTDFGILVGCDYNKSKKIKNIGPVKAHQLIKEYKNLETIKTKLNIDIDSIDYIKCRELFNYKLSDEEKNISRWVKPDINDIEEFMEKNNIYYNINTIRKTFDKKLEIIYDFEQD